MRYLLSLILLTLSLFGFDYHLKSYTMAEGVECFFGLSSKVNEINGGNIVNSCYIKTDEGYVVIDSGPTYSYARQAFQFIEANSSLPVKFVINTSSDEVHILGNGFYQERGAQLLGPLSYKAYQGKENTKLQTKVSPKTYTNTRLVPLDTYVDDDLTITLGGLKIQILKPDPKSDRYLMVYIPSKEILFVGDMVFNNRIPPLKHNRSLKDWLKALKKIEGMSWQRIISSHGIKTKYSALKNTTSYLKMLRDEVTLCLQEKRSKKECQNRVKMYAFMEDTLYDVWHPNNVSVAYDELKQSVKAQPKPTVKKDPKPEPKPVVAHKESHPPTPQPTEKKVAQTKAVAPVGRIQSYPYATAIHKARANKKIVLIKIRSDNCPYCDELDTTIQSNSTVKRLIQQNYLMVSKNISRESLPLGIEVRLTPSLAFIRPDTKQVVMITPGIEALGELIDILKEGAQDGRRNGYLK